MVGGGGRVGGGRCVCDFVGHNATHGVGPVCGVLLRNLAGFHETRSSTLKFIIQPYITFSNSYLNDRRILTSRFVQVKWVHCAELWHKPPQSLPSDGTAESNFELTKSQFDAQFWSAFQEKCRNPQDPVELLTA